MLRVKYGSRPDTSSSWLCQDRIASYRPRSGSNWSKAENKAFEDALAVHFNDDDKWRKIARAVPGKTIEDLKLHYEVLHDDVEAIESDKVPLPRYTRKKSHFTGNQNKKKAPRKVKKGSLWTENEHRRFLYGLEKYGRGDWRSISRYCVRSKTNSQVASHAQKFYSRLNSEKVGKRTSINDITLDYSLYNPNDVVLGFDAENASTDVFVETKPPLFVGKKITDPGPSTTKLSIHDPCIASAEDPSTHGLDFVDQMILDPEPSPGQFPKRAPISVNHSIQDLGFASQTIMYNSSSATELPKNDIYVPEYSNKLFSDFGFPSQSIVAPEPSTAQVSNLDTVMSIPVSGFTSHTVMDPCPSTAQLSTFGISDLDLANQLSRELYFATPTTADPGPSTVRLPTFDIYAPAPANDPFQDSDLFSRIITDSGPWKTEYPAYNIGFASALSQQIEDQEFNFVGHQIIMDPNPSQVEFPTFEICDPVFANQPIQDMDLYSQMIIDPSPSTARLSTFDVRFPALTIESMQHMDLANWTNVGHLPSATELLSDFHVSAIANQPIQELGFVADMIIDPDFSTPQLPACDDFALSFATEPIQDTDLTSLMDMDHVPLTAQLQNHYDFASSLSDQPIQSLERSTGMPTSFDNACDSDMVILDEFMLPCFLDMD